MIDHDEIALAGIDRDSRFLELAEQIAERLQSGEKVDAGDYVRQYPQWAGAIRKLLPTMNDLADYGRAIDREGRRRQNLNDINVDLHSLNQEPKIEDIGS